MLSPVVDGAVYDVAPGLVWPLAGAVAVTAEVLLYVSSATENRVALRDWPRDG